MQDPYGYILGTTGKDKDHLDVFIGPNPESERVYIIDQIDPVSGEFDEHKIILGASSALEAEHIYFRNYAPGWKGLGAINSMNVDEFRTWSISKPIPAGPSHIRRLHEMENEKR